MRYLPLAAHGAAACGSAEHKPVRTPGAFSVQHNHVVGNGVEAVANSLPALKNLLRDKWTNTATLEVVSARCILIWSRQVASCSLIPVPAVVQQGEGVVIFLCHAGNPEHVVVQLLPAVRKVEDHERHKEKTLVAALQLVHQIFRFFAVGGEVGRQDVHIVAAADSLFLFLNLHTARSGIFRFTVLVAFFWSMACT